MSKHTPGPWHWDSDQIKGDPLGRVRYRVTAIGKTVTQCYYSSSDEQAEWDARLIAAAPDLLEALRGALKALDAIGDEMTVGERYTNAGQYLIDALQPAREAITKATGEKS